MKAIKLGVVAGLLLASAASVEAAGLNLFRPSYSYAYYYDPCPPVQTAWPGYPYYYPSSVALPAPGGMRLPSSYQREYAPPTAAPPSPELIRVPPREPNVSESRSSPADKAAENRTAKSTSFYDIYPVAADPVRPAGLSAETASICFWNLTGRPITLRVRGQSYTMDRGRQLTLQLPRTFLWQVDARDPETSQVAETQRALEVVIRR